VTTKETIVRAEITRILNKVFSVDFQTDSSKSDISQYVTWDSLKHVQIILELEDSFDFEISDSEIEKIFDYNSSVEYVLSKLKDK
jgi:acyl carrier protein